jgi:hypothetical protein
MKFSPQIHLFLCFALLAQMGAPGLVRADPPQSNVICGRINTPRAMVDEAEKKKNRERLFGSWKDLLEKTIGDRHRTSHLATAAARSVQAQNSFLYFLQSKTIEICDIQLGAELGMKDLSQKISETSALSDKAQMCGRFDQLQAGYKKSHDGMATVNDEMSKKLEALKSFFVDSANTNLSNLDQIPEAGTNYLVPGPVVPRTMWQRFFGGASIPKLNKAPSLREEAAAIWGNNAKGLQKADFQPDPNSLFGGIMSRLGNDLKASHLFAKRLETQNGEIQKLQKNCGVVAPNQINPETTPASDQPDISGLKSPTELHPQKDADLDPDAAKKHNEANPTEAPVEQTTETPGSFVIDNNGNRDKVDPYVPETQSSDDDWRAGAQPPPTKTKEEGWISKNKGLLLTVGAGAAAVGGILWYKNSQDKKAEQDASALEMEARALASSQAGSGSEAGSPSGSTNTDSTVGGTPANIATPQGSKLLVSGIPSGSVAANANLPEITVAILNPEGILTQDNQTEIIVSCAEPANCSLSGTGQARASNGKARFSDLHFTSAHQSVKLIFRSAGFESVTSSAFGVTASDTGSGTNTGGGPRE